MLTEEDVKDWRRTARGKLVCPECGQTGYSCFDQGSWIHKHVDHAACVCGKTVTLRGLVNHQSRCPAALAHPR